MVRCQGYQYRCAVVHHHHHQLALLSIILLKQTNNIFCLKANGDEGIFKMCVQFERVKFHIQNCCDENIFSEEERSLIIYSFIGGSESVLSVK